MKKGFSLFITLFIIVLFGFLSLDYFQNKAFFNQIDTLKSLDIKSEKYLLAIKKEYKLYKTLENYLFDDKEFALKIEKSDDMYEVILTAYHHPIRKYLTLPLL